MGNSAKTDSKLPQQVAGLMAEQGTVAYSVETSGRLRNVVDPVSWVTDGKYDSNTLQLFEDVSQVYELILARMEFRSLGYDLEEFWTEVGQDNKTYEALLGIYQEVGDEMGKSLVDQLAFGF